jgi:hypothetical protein
MHCSLAAWLEELFPSFFMKFLISLLLASQVAFHAQGYNKPAPDGAGLPPVAAGPTAAPMRVAATGSRVRVTFTFASPPAAAAARVAPMLYNKPRVLHFEEDDSPATIFSEVYPLFNGGVATNGVRYPGLRFTDGCGNARPYTGAADINGHNPYDNSIWLDPGPNHPASALLWSQAQTLLDHGWDIENHSDLHTPANPAPAQQVADLDVLIANRLNGYKPSVLIVPTNFSGYPTAAFNAGYIAVSSASQGDNYAMLNPYNETRVLVDNLPVPPSPFVYRRYSADLYYGETDQDLLARLKTLTDDLLAPGNNASEVYLQRVFTHFINFNTLVAWLNYTQAKAQDQLWVTSLREYEEYRRVRSQVVKSETLRGNTLTVDLDYSTLSANTRFQNLTLLAESSAPLTSVTVTGADSISYNLSTKMVNIFRRQSAPAASALPVELSSFGASRENTQVHVAWRTASERNAQRFLVQRSADGHAFATVGEVAAVGSSTSRQYNFLDASATARQAGYYRLNLVDNDGTTAFGPVAYVAASLLLPQVRVAPNPTAAANGLQVTVQGCQDQLLRLQLLDDLGRVVLAQSLRPVSAQQQVVMPLPAGQRAGVYVLQVIGAAQPLRTRVLLTR